MKKKNVITIGLLSGILLGALFVRVQGVGVPTVSSAVQGEALSREKKEAIVRRVATEFREKYVFADVAEKMATLVEGKLGRGEYDGIASLEPLAARLQEDLRSVSQDRHVKVLPGLISEFDADANLLRRENYGFNAVEVLPGNIGYLDFFQFYSIKDAGPTAIAAMNFLANCDALIVDLRSNGGGYPELRSLICSYFFTEPACLIEFRGRQGVTQDWTLPYVPGPRMPKIPVYVLISRFTFSCAEDFSFCLQNLGRATVIGETTRGGAHDAKMWTFPMESISLQIPFNEAVDPQTKKTWEGVGIRPDVGAPASQAFQVAMREAARSLLKTAVDRSRKGLMEWIVQDYESQLEPMTLRPQALQAYAGSYGSFRIALEGDQLYFYSNDRPKQRLAPIAPDDFKIVSDDRHGFAKYRVRFARDVSGRVTEMFIHDLEGNRFPVQMRK